MQNEMNCSEPPISTLQRGILCVLIYFDIFDHPLRPAEIHKFLSSDGITEDDVRAACATEPLKRRIRSVEGLYLLSDRRANLVADRRVKERRARLMWNAPLFVSQIIRKFPFVRAVFVSGELSKSVASTHSDIDFSL